MKAELKPLEDTETKSRNYNKVVLAGIFCLSLCVNVALSALLASKETCVTGVALLEVPLKTERRRLDADNLLRGCARECVITNAGAKECTDGEMVWELVDPDMTDIPSKFLKGSKDLTGTLKLGAAVKKIGKNAFYKTKLTGLDLSDAASLKSIGAKAFRNTDIKGTIMTPFSAPLYKGSSFPKGVSIITIPPGLKECAVASSATEPCWELADPGMTDIPAKFLKENTDLTGTLKLGAAVETIGGYAFSNTKLTGLDLSNAASLVSIGDRAFDYTDITGTLVIPAKVETIGGYAFYKTKLTGLDLSNAASLVSIGDRAFFQIDITGTLVIPAKVETIGGNAFYNTKLTGLDLSNATSLVSIGSYAFIGGDITGTLVIPAKVETIGGYAFYTTKLTGLDLSNAASLVSIGDRAFVSTDITGTLVIPANVETIGGYAFYQTKLTGLDLSNATSLVSIGDHAFRGSEFRNTDITGTLVIPANVETIGEAAFLQTKLTGLDLSDAASLASIGDFTFANTDITGTLVIPANVETIRAQAFYQTKLAGLDLSNAASLVSIGYGAFYDTDITGTIVTPFTVPTIGDYAFPSGVTIVKG